MGFLPDLKAPFEGSRILSLSISSERHIRHPVLRTAGLPLGTWTPDEADDHMYSGLNGCGP
ncbi:uncharacterized protein CLUP02_08456 [Colletotrichum lupini]|uniref:Uncharacterized protein n=1 Tax=Colletotrichum lupini TaxID=145971 RepID=A0A9Q8ST01_9PEZI|nr:uncharacterized protein CLUP02_08456 [Colletotrichum lupini]UQC82966.1 hypothetical protein CLUP02_08456 [Colletotrichum lupini]